MSAWLVVFSFLLSPARGDVSSEAKKFIDVMAREVYLPASVKLLPPPEAKRISVDVKSPPPIDSPDKIRRAQKELDGYFEEITAGYPPATREFLHEVYFRGKGLKESPGLMENEGNFAAASITRRGDSVTYEVLVDPAVRLAPVWFRLKLIHEVAVHLGQAHQRVSQIGAERFATEQKSGAFELFSELTAAIVEKRVIDKLPVEAVLADIKTNIKRPAMREALLKEYKFRREAEFALYPWLRQRIAYRGKADKPSLDQYEIRKFVNLYETKELGARGP